MTQEVLSIRISGTRSTVFQYLGLGVYPELSKSIVVVLLKIEEGKRDGKRKHIGVLVFPPLFSYICMGHILERIQA
jgi:hypothetical protein